MIQALFKNVILLDIRVENVDNFENSKRFQL